MADFEFKSEAKAWVMIPLLKNNGAECVLDMRPIVLCKNCKNERNGFCILNDIKVTPEFFCADGERNNGSKVRTIDIRKVSSLWCDDITFCQEDCEDIGCPRNKHNIRDRRFPHSYFVDLPPDCPKKEEKQDDT